MPKMRKLLAPTKSGLYSTEEMAKLTGFKPETIRTWLRTGVIIGEKWGNRWRVRVPEVKDES